MQSKNKIKVRTLRFPITTEPLKVEEEVQHLANELLKEPKTLSVDVLPCHNSYYFVYDFIVEVLQ